MKTKETAPRYWRSPLDAARMQPARGQVAVVAERCKGCGFCVEWCPRSVLVLSESFNRKGYHPPKVVKPAECANCNLCEMICPEFAIFSYALSPQPMLAPVAVVSEEVQR